MATNNILKKGYLYQFRNKQEAYGWERLYFVLHGQSAKNEARLDWYESLESSLSNPGLRSGIFVEEITRVERIAYQSKMEYMYGPSARFLFGIYTCRKEEPYVMKCVDAEMLNDWIKQLSRLLRDVRQLKRTNRKKAKIAENVYSAHNTPQSLTFAREVDVEETAAAQRQGISGRYRFVLSRQHLSLTNLEDSGTAIFWHYSHVRRFGYSDRTFTIEGGQRSGPGEGLFILKNCEGHALFIEVQEKIRLLREPFDDGQSPKSPAVGDSSRNGPSLLGAPPTGKQGNGKDTPKTPMLQDNRNATPNPRGDNPLSSPALVNDLPQWEPVFSASREETSEENAHQQSSGEDDDAEDNSSDEDNADGHSTSLKKKPKIPPKNFDLGSLAMQVASQSMSNSPGNENVDRGAKGHQSKADKPCRGSSIVQFGPFKRFMSPPPRAATAATGKTRNDGSSEVLPLVNCWDEGTEQAEGSSPVQLSPVMADDISPGISKTRKPFWKSFRERERPAGEGRETRQTADATFSEGESEEETVEEAPPLLPKNFLREELPNTDEQPILVVPLLPPRPKPSPKEAHNSKGRKASGKATSADKRSQRQTPSTPDRTVPIRYVQSDAVALQNAKVVEETKEVQTFTPIGPKISEVLLHLESCQVSESGVRNTDDLHAQAPEGDYHRIDLRSEAAGKARINHRDTNEEHHLYGQSLICSQMMQRVQDEPEYEDIFVDTKPKKNSKKTKK